MMNRDLSLYIHIPFCARKCRYCDFTSFNAPAYRIGEYVQALRRELADAGDEFEGRRLYSIYIGGGTPSYVDASVIAGTMDLTKELFEISPVAEISIEVNPGSADSDKLKVYRDCGINRLSIGLQSMDDTELKTLGRIHDADDFLKTYDAALKAGFENINVDLISAIPGQTLLSWEHTLRRVCEMGPEHISAYSLQLEEGTYMYEHRDEYVWPDEDTDREMYHMTSRILGEYGYERYEISNYARPGSECKHNTVYWTGGEYLGIGLGAASYTDGIRYKNTDDLREYLCGAGHMEEMRLSRSDRMEEYMFLGLRMIHGVTGSGFEERFGVSMEEIYGRQLKELSDDGLIIRTQDTVRLSERGLDISNYCLAKFII